jgi:uncharacterized protein YjbI with pentapeptide repeats
MDLHHVIHPEATESPPNANRERKRRRSPAPTPYDRLMPRLTIRGTSVNLPAFLEEATFAPVTPGSLTGKLVSNFHLSDAKIRTLTLRDTRMTDGQVRSVRTEATEITEAEVNCVEFSNCELSSLTWTGGEISRTRFTACKLLGARFENVKMKHAVFVDCQLDYATLSRMSSSGPVAFVRCRLREAEFTGCDMTRAVFEKCDLTLANFGKGRHAGCDLRGNDVSTLRGAANLRRVVLTSAQLVNLAQALATELEISLNDEV